MKGARFVKKAEIPEYHWGLIVQCWDPAPAKRPTFWELLERMHTDHAYVLPGSDLDAVRAYERTVYRNFGPARVVTVGARLLTPREADAAVARANQLLGRPVQAGLGMASIRSFGTGTLRLSA
jgi:hypothetical protein